jgi:hypothetical protein
LLAGSGSLDVYGFTTIRQDIVIMGLALTSIESIAIKIN